MHSVRRRYLIPGIIAAGLAAMCFITALILFRQQSALAATLREVVTSRRAAVDLEECLTDVAALLNADADGVAALNERLTEHLQRTHDVANTPEELAASRLLERGLADYLSAWEAIPPKGDPLHAEMVRGAQERLDEGLQQPCQQFRLFNGQLLEQSTLDQEVRLGNLALGMTGIGILGGFAGIAFGFGLTRALGQSIRRIQVQIRGAAGKLNAEQAEVVVLDDGQFSGVHAQLDELTSGIERVLANLKQRELEVLRSDQLAAVGHLAAGVAHEIRNPLTSIKMLVQSGQEQDGRHPLTTADLQVIEKEVRRMESSLQTFLDFARPPRAQRTMTDLVPLLNEVVGLVRGRAVKQRVSLSVNVPPGESPALIDADQFRQVLVNLVLNSLDAQPRGGAVELKLKSSHEAADGVLELCVADEGPGIAPDMIPKLFQPFVSNKETGLGLGLVISRRIVEDHGGSLTAENAVDGGAVFRILLPTGKFP